LIALFASLSTAASASAGQILITYSGNVTASNTPGIDVGAPYSGSLLYDTTDALLSPPPYATYAFGPSDTLAITVDGCTFSATGPGVNSSSNTLTVAHDQVSNGQATDDFDAVTNPSATSNCNAFSPYELFFAIAGPPGLLAGTEIPSTFDLSKVVQPGYGQNGTGAGAFFPGSNGSPYFFLGDYTSLQVATVPEPCPGLLTGLTLCGLVLAWRCLYRGRLAPRGLKS
jgi:hypothetical protein